MRLTEKDEQGNWCVKGLPWKNLYAGTPITKETQELLYGALRKLKDYEDTGLSPDEVETVNDFTKSQIAHLLKKYQEEKEKHEWIPCSERLPSAGREVLLQTKGNQMVVAFLDKKINGMWIAGIIFAQIYVLNQSHGNHYQNHTRKICEVGRMNEIYYKTTVYKGATLLTWAIRWFKMSNDTFFRCYGFNFNPHDYKGLYELARKEVYGK